MGSVRPGQKRSVQGSWHLRVSPDRWEVTHRGHGGKGKGRVLKVAWSFHVWFVLLVLFSWDFDLKTEVREKPVHLCANQRNVFPLEKLSLLTSDI